MIIIGGKGFAKELLEDLVSSKYSLNEDSLFFYDDISDDLPIKLFDKYNILRNFSEVENVIKDYSPNFCIGVGTPRYRKCLTEEFLKRGGKLKSVISSFARLGSFDNTIGSGVSIMGGVQLTNSISIGKGTLLNINCTIGHDVNIGEFVEVCPSVSVSGHCEIGDYSSIGTGAIILPGVKIGRNCIIGAGTVVTQNIPDNSLVVGVPGKVIRTLPHFNTDCSISQP